MSCSVLFVGFLLLPNSPKQEGAQQMKQGILLEEFIYEEAPFPSCHASTVAQAADGSLVAAWFGGTDEGNRDVGIWVSRKEKDEWSDPIEVANGIQSDGKRFPCWNPALFQSQEGPLLLFFKVGPNPRQWWGEMMVSSDHGKTWTDRRALPDNGIGPVKNKPVQLSDGTLICGSSIENDGWRVHVERTSDLGKTWETTGPLHGKEIGAIQPTIFNHGEGRLQMLCRDRNGKGHHWETWSQDGGKTWSPFSATELPNPNAGADGVTLRDGTHLLVYNHTVRGGPFPQSREMLNVAVSPDGKKWDAALVLERSNGEYSYPAVIQAESGMIHITYTWKRRKIKHVVVDPAQLERVPIEEGVWPH